MKFTCYETLRRWLPLYYVHILNDKLLKNIHEFNIILLFFSGYNRLYFLNLVSRFIISFLLKVYQLIIDTSISFFYRRKGKRKLKTSPKIYYVIK